MQRFFAWLLKRKEIQKQKNQKSPREDFNLSRGLLLY